ILCGAMAWSIANARWILGRDELTSFLIWIAPAAVLWSYLSARLGISPWLAHALGCFIGAVVLIEAIGISIPMADPSLGGWFHATANSVTQAYLDLTWRHQISTIQYGHFCLILGIVVWGTAQAAAYDVFAYHRSVNGVLLLSVVLIANMALTTNSDNQDQFVALVVFSAAALLLLLLAHAADERSSWLRHRIWRGRDFQAPHIQGGFAFATAAVAGALILTTVASSAPLSDFVGNLDLRDNFGWLEGYLPNGNNSRVTQNSDFGATSPVASSFKADKSQVFTIRVQSGSVAFHWRMVSYDTFQTNGWALGPNSREDQVLAGSTIDAGTQDLVGTTTPGRTQVSIAVHIQDSSITHLVVANEPDTVNVGVKRTLVSSSPSSANVAWLTSDATDYTVSAYVPNVDPAGAGLTEWRLRQAGTAYPAGLVATYTQGAGQVGTEGRNLLTEIQTWAESQGNTFGNEYDVAKAVQTYLHSDRFTYNTDIASQMQQQCQGLSTVDCFATIRQGFCEQYATTMTMLMRTKGYPARYVLGYLPGAIDPNSLIQQVTNQQKHAWVEVFFPTYGWITFDPTGGSVGQPTVLVPGSAVTSSPTPAATSDPAETSGSRPSRRPSDLQGGSTTSGDNGAATVIVPFVLMAILVLALFVLWRRRLKSLDEPDAVYRSVVRLASRLGYKPAPTQTVYEYAGMLANVVPKARESLGVVATAAVEVTYGRHVMGAERLAALASAQKIVRRALFRLVWRLPMVGGRSRSKAAGRGKGARRGSRR
ncbi:MAG TPA: transglutaminase domain-containing protein, partial [Candidatus Limnocylindrales bacterium]